MATTYRFDHLLAADGWLSPGWVRVDADGMIAAVGRGDGRPEATAIGGLAMPGIPNLHSHAYVRALAGFAEPLGDARRDFWSWRREMYRLAAALQPDDLEAIAQQAYVEMVKSGFTSVAEFHYLHNDRGGSRYADPAELAHRLFAAAERAGIGITLLPCLYMHGGIDERLAPYQMRFGSASVDEFVALVESIRSRHATSALVRVGVAAHSVRAVTGEELRALVRGVGDMDGDAPIHIHIAEQRREVEESLARRGRRPLEWLAHHAQIGPGWTLVHATHCDAGELEMIASSGAMVALCPLTEATLGDGLFPLRTYESLSGVFGIGSDSNTLIDPTLELLTLEYGQRLTHERRDVHAGAEGVGRQLLRACIQSGRASLGQQIGPIEAGRRADLVTFRVDDPTFAGHDPSTFLDALIVRAGMTKPTDVMVAGRWVVRSGHHLEEDEVGATFLRTMRTLRERVIS